MFTDNVMCLPNNEIEVTNCLARKANDTLFLRTHGIALLNCTLSLSIILTLFSRDVTLIRIANRVNAILINKILIPNYTLATINKLISMSTLLRLHSYVN